MIRNLLCTLAVLGGLAKAVGGTNTVPIEQRRWFEMRTARFYIYSCAAPRDVYALATNLEQFSETYTLLTGMQTVSPVPIIVIAFPDHEAFSPFLPLYQGKPANLAGFFRRSSDQNLIVLELPSTNSALRGFEVIFHEYAHYLFRRYARVWPLWLDEGVADLYSTFETSGYTVRLGRPIEPYVDLLSQKSLLPLADLFAVDTDSPQYNERDRQGIFYAQAWLLTHYLLAGGGGAYRPRFDQFNRLLQEGQVPEEAFTNAMRISLRTADAGLRAYLDRGRFDPLQWPLPRAQASVAGASTRMLTPVEIHFLLGIELLRTDRPDAAESYFMRALKMAPASPLPYEGLGFLAAARKQHEQAASRLKEALQHGSGSFLVHYIYAEEKYQLTADSANRHAPLPKDQAAEIRGELHKAMALMPGFAPAHHLLGFFELVQADDLAAAEIQLQSAIQLEPENPAYLISLAQAQLAERKPAEARKTLGPLLRPGVEADLRKPAEELLQAIGRAMP